ncbi:MAG TPA: helicase-related protein, partial [Chloroflexota bacterium]|nr:helicase-related protein [Chloroflexota bacterium]
MAEQWDLPRKSAPADETIDAALLAELRARVDAGASQLIMLAGPVRRAALALRVAHAMPGPVVMVNATMGSVHAVLRGEPALGRRVLIVAGPLDSAELALRLREIATAAPQVIAVEPDRLWLARMLRALRACRPHLVIVEAGALAAGTLERHARTETVLRWVRDVLPGAGVLALCHPALPAFAQHIGSLLNATPRAVDPLLPRRIALRGRLLSHERDRLPALLDALRTVHGSAFIAVPSRGKAVALTGALARAGFDATAYHGGLTATERAAILGAVRDGRQQLLVATEALATVADLPCPALLAYTHPPRSLEALVVLAERAEPAQRRVPLLMLYTAQDLAAQAEAATRSVPALARLRRIYGALRHQSNRGQVLLDPEQLTP